MKHFHYNVMVFKNHKVTTIIAAILFCITFYPLNSLVLASDFDITQKRVIESTDQPDQWLVHGRTYAEQRYSPLNQINTETVKNLGIDRIVFESSRIVFAIFSPAIFVAAYTDGGDPNSSLSSETLFTPLSP